MASKRRIQKSVLQRVLDCETHLYFLWDARRLYPQQEDRFKQIAGELRVLVCETKHNHPLLLELIEQFGFRYELPPPGPPLDKHPMQMVGDSTSPVYQQLAAETAAAKGDEQKLSAVQEKRAALRRCVPLREYVEKGLAVVSMQKEYSYRELTLAVAQQLGSSHEDRAVDESLVILQDFRIMGHMGHVVSIIGFADRIIDAGTRFMEFLVSNHGYQPRYLKRLK